MTTHYTTDADGKGWLNPRWDADGGTYPPLPQHLKVRLEGTGAGRDRFTVLEGRQTGKGGSVARKAEGGSYLTTTPPPHGSPASVTFDLQGKSLTWTGGPTLRAIADLAPLPPGTYDLELPYEAHRYGGPYEPQSAYAKTWFLIGHTGDRFLHPGRVSEGCVTVSDVARWTELYRYLIKARTGDGQSVGTIRII